MNKNYPSLKFLSYFRSVGKDIDLKIGAMLIIPAFLMLFLALPVSAQKTSGQISGNVTDQGGAALPDATVTATQVGTGLQRTVTTSGEGNYTIPDLPIGLYKISVTKSGFKETVADSVSVNVSTSTRQDFSMQIGQVGERVEITADAIQVETQTGTVGEVVTGEQVRELPLNGRSFVQLTQLQPGVSAQNNFDPKNKGLFAGVDFSVNGNSAQSNLFLTDGANNNDTGSNRTILLYPSIEAIAEFKSLRNSYGPEYGQAAGAVISIVTRGGENQFHGSLFYFGRNNALNATEFFTNRSGLKKDSLRRNDFGFSLGGPIIKDRLFFFYSQEWNKELRGATRTASVPTVAERTGDFRARRIIPAGAPGPDGDIECDGPAISASRPGGATQIIPQASLSPGGLALTKLYPAPNIAWSPASGNCINWASSLSSPINFREENVRIDYKLNKSNQLFGRYTQDSWSNGSPILYSNLWGDDAFPGVESSWSQPSRQVAVKLTSTLSTTAINEVQFSYSANRIIITPGIGGDVNTEINTKIPGFFPDSVKVNGLDRPHPVFWGGIAPFFANNDPNLWTQAPFNNSLDIYSIRDDFSKVWSDHALKMGFLFDKAQKNEDAGPSNETPQFWGQGDVNSGNYLASILTQGSLFGYNESDKQAVANTKYTNLEFYFGDTWKVRSNVTLELGARYSLLFEPYDGNDAISSFDPAFYNPARPSSDPCNGLVVPKGTNPCQGIAGASTPTEFSNRSLRKNNYKNLAPRLGVAWDVFKNGKTAIRGGFGQFFLRERVGPVVGGLTSNPPFVKGIAGQRTLDGTIFNNGGAPSNGAPSRSFSPEAATPYSLQFNISAAQQLWKDTVIEFGYVANRARDQITHLDINQPVQANRLAAAFTGDANGVNPFRPYSNYGAIYQFAREGFANYDSLQILFKTRFAKSFNFQAAYTWSKSLANFGLGDSSNGPSGFAQTDSYNAALDYGPSDVNRPHIFVANLIYNLPKFKSSNSFVQTVLGGWEVASIIQISSGTSLTPIINNGGLNYIVPDGPVNFRTQAFGGQFSGTGTSQGNLRPNRVEGVPCTVTNGDGTQFFNPAAFTLVGLRIGQNGNSSRGTCLGSPTKNVDFSIYKNFSPSWLKESFFGEKSNIQFRFEFFNAFNTPQFRGDRIDVAYYGGSVRCGTGATQCSPTNNLITALVTNNNTQAGAIANPNGNFGRSGLTRGAREIQYALKFTF